MANKRNAILLLHRQGTSICEILRMLQVLHSTIFKAMKNSRSLARKETEHQQAEKNWKSTIDKEMSHR